jgi:hypothetical protein
VSYLLKDANSSLMIMSALPDDATMPTSPGARNVQAPDAPQCPFRGYLGFLKILHHCKAVPTQPKQAARRGSRAVCLDFWGAVTPRHPINPRYFGPQRVRHHPFVIRIQEFLP